MGLQKRKTRLKRSKAQPTFTDDDVWEMIAFLDCCVKFNPDHKRFKATVTAYLEAHTSKTFTFQQVDRRIQRLWQEQGVDVDRCDHHSIYHHGSKYLRCVQENQELQTKIAERAAQINHLMASQFLYTPSRTTRSKGAGYAHGFRLAYEVDVCTRRQRRKVAGDTSSAKITPEGRLGDNLSEVPASVVSSSMPTFSPQPTPPPIGSKGLLLAKTESIRDVSSSIESIATWTSDVNNSTGGQQSRIPRQSAIDTTENNSTSSLDPEPGLKLGRSSNASVKMLALIEGLRKENLWYRQENEKLREQNAELEIKKRATESAKRSLSREDYANEQNLSDYLSQIYSLEARIISKEDLLPFMKPGGKRLTGLERSEIVTNLNIIERHLSSVLVFPESKTICSDFIVPDRHGDLALLSLRAFGGSTIVPPNNHFRHVFRSLVSAAVTMWVFESDFDDPYLGGCNLQEETIRVVRMQVDENAARNLDFAAHYNLMNGKYIQEKVIPERAAELAGRLRLALDPLLVAEKAHSGWSKDISKLWAKRVTMLEYIFRTALEIKAKVIVVQDRFEVVLPTHGDLYDERLMQEETGCSVNDSARVRLVTAPGLQRFEFSRKRVDRNSFCLPTPGADPGFDVMKKAMVVLDSR